MSVGGTSDAALGSELGGYRIEALLGRGGMGAVYRAEETALGRKVALKVIAPELAQDDRFRERFLRESKTAASLDHPHIVPIFRAGEDDGALFLAMRYVEGTDLARLLRAEGALPPARAIELLGQVAEALDAAHEKGLVHRDVKPSNVLIAVASGRENAYLADFGLTKRTGSLSGISAPGDVVGTLEYVAPEQITGGDVEAQADLYSLGCVLYECLTGQSPFPRATDVALLWAHVHEQPQRASAVRPELPRAVDAVLERALHKEPARRFETAGELVAAARPALALGEAPTVAPRRRRWAVPFAVALALAVAAAIAVVVTRDSGGGLASVSANAVGVIDPASNQLVADVPVGIDPESIAVGEDGVWVANVEDETVSRIDPADTGARPRTIPVGDYPSDLAVGSGSVWVALGALAEVVRVNPDQNTAASPISALGAGTPCGGPRASLALAGRFLWFACEVPELGRVDTRTGKGVRLGLESGVVISPSSLLPEFADLAFGLGGSLWIVNRSGFQVIEVDPNTSQEQGTITVGRAPTAIAVGENELWVANFEADTVTRAAISAPGEPPDTTDFPVGDGPVDVAVGEGAVWVANRLGRSVTRIDAETGEVVKTIPIANEPQRIAAGEDRVWVTVRAAPPSEGEDG